MFYGSKLPKVGVIIVPIYIHFFPQFPLKDVDPSRPTMLLLHMFVFIVGMMISLHFPSQSVIPPQHIPNQILKRTLIALEYYFVIESYRHTLSERLNHSAFDFLHFLPHTDPCLPIFAFTLTITSFLISASVPLPNDLIDVER